ncbi:MAG: hypothetical protein A2X64_00405 [Ignavibacteria bacterium GWF2_33_9]|nr:MAG: hypothetical protein A2X64_00405 [Ignavibacteria bacterium GWF2_33_9]
MDLKYLFEWNPEKAKSNAIKHKVKFEQAASIFRDPNAISIYDEEHSESEDRWITIGIAYNSQLLVVIHTYEKINEFSVEIRVISARKATKNETEIYNGDL